MTPGPRSGRLRGLRRPVRLAALALAATLVSGCGSSGDQAAPAGDDAVVVVDAGPQHVHGLGVNRADGDLYIATHSGLWRSAADAPKAERVGDVRHDLMGFTVVGPDRFLASGHPDARHGMPPQMGLQRSIDGGRSWQTVSLLGQADLHVLRADGRRIYGVDSGTGAFVTSGNAGRSWTQRRPPAAVLDVAIDPADSDRVVAATEAGVFASPDTGRTWRPLRDDISGLLAWPLDDALYIIEPDGTVSNSADGGREFERLGSLGAQPEAFAVTGAGELFAAVHGGEVRVSTDGGATWRTRSTP